MTSFKLKDHANASNQGVSFKPLNRFIKRMRDLFSRRKKCSYCHIKINSYTLGSGRDSAFEQCYIICSNCKRLYHFLCYMEAIGAAKGDGAIFRWPVEREQLGSYNLAPCPKCKIARTCYFILDNKKIYFGSNVVVSMDINKIIRASGKSWR